MCVVCGRCALLWRGQLDEDLRVEQLERRVGDAQADDPHGAAAAAARSELRALLAELVRHRVAVFAVRAGRGAGQ